MVMGMVPEMKLEMASSNMSESQLMGHICFEENYNV